MTWLSAAQFRRQFPALESSTWLDTPGSPPAAQAVADAVSAAVADWLAGDFDWQAWDQAPQVSRRLFAGYLGVSADHVALVGSVAEAAAVVAGGLPPGRIVVPDEEFRSNLLPWLGLDPTVHEVVRVPARDGVTRTEDLVAACSDGAVLLAVSEVLSNTGVRADLDALRAATDEVGARLFVDATQSVGVLHLDLPRLRPDYVAVHGYKWMLCPRGAAWLVARADRVPELRPVAPSWRSGPPPHTYFGGSSSSDAVAARCDASPAWFSWIGAGAALGLLGRTEPAAVERHAVGLGRAFLEGATRLGLRPTAAGRASQIVSVRVPDPAKADAALREHAVKATVLGDRLRVGFHYFNDTDDVAAVLTALEHAT